MIQDKIYGGAYGSDAYKSNTVESLAAKDTEFRSKIDVRNAVAEQFVRVGADGTIFLEYPLSVKGQLFDVRLERLNMLLNFDYKQMFNTSFDKENKAIGHFKKADSNEGEYLDGDILDSDGAKTKYFKIGDNVQDIRSLVHTHKLGVVTGYEESIDYLTQIKWTKKVSFEKNTPEIKQWLLAIGLTNEIYENGTTTNIPSQDILIGPDAVLDIVMEANDADFNVYGDAADQLVLAQVIADRPIHSIIAYNANDDSSYFRTILLGKSFTFKLYHHWLNKPINKLTLDRSIISIEIRGRTIK